MWEEAFLMLLCVFVSFYVGVTLHIIYLWVLFCSLICLAVSMSVDTENYPQTLCRYQDTF